jgi:uncharacterized damage-inducible protein DinB
VSDTRWRDALAEHEVEVRAFRDALARVPAERWHAPPMPGKWSAAELVLHVTRSYEMGAAAMEGGPGMRLRVPRPVAWFARTVLLPRMLDARRFPRGAESPGEVVPGRDEAGRTTPASADARLAVAARDACASLRRAATAPRPPRFTHAYFGALPPLAVVRLLSAHTRHHAGQLARIAAGTPVRVTTAAPTVSRR